MEHLPRNASPFMTTGINMEKTNITTKRDVFNLLAFEVLSYIENLESVTDIKFDANPGAVKADFLTWEKQNFPYKFPEEIRAFYELLNGFNATWSIECFGRKVSVGEMKINTLKDITRFPLDNANPGTSLPLENVDCDKTNSSSKERFPMGKPCAAFLLDSSPRIGKIVLMYRTAPISLNEHTSTHFNQVSQVWLQDLSCQWWFIADSFKDYLRLMVTHLGVIGWQSTFSDAKCDPICKQWMKLFCPERLGIDSIGDDCNVKIAVKKTNSKKKK